MAIPLGATANGEAAARKAVKDFLSDGHADRLDKPVIDYLTKVIWEEAVACPNGRNSDKMVADALRLFVPTLQGDDLESRVGRLLKDVRSSTDDRDPLQTRPLANIIVDSSNSSSISWPMMPELESQTATPMARSPQAVAWFKAHPPRIRGGGPGESGKDQLDLTPGTDSSTPQSAERIPSAFDEVHEHGLSEPEQGTLNISREAGHPTEGVQSFHQGLETENHHSLPPVHLGSGFSQGRESPTLNQLSPLHGGSSSTTGFRIDLGSIASCFAHSEMATLESRGAALDQPRLSAPVQRSASYSGPMAAMAEDGGPAAEGLLPRSGSSPPSLSFGASSAAANLALGLKLNPHAAEFVPTVGTKSSDGEEDGEASGFLDADQFGENSIKNQTLTEALPDELLPSVADLHGELLRNRAEEVQSFPFAALEDTVVGGTFGGMSSSPSPPRTESPGTQFSDGQRSITPPGGSIWQPAVFESEAAPLSKMAMTARPGGIEAARISVAQVNGGGSSRAGSVRLHKSLSGSRYSSPSGGGGAGGPIVGKYRHRKEARMDAGLADANSPRGTRFGRLAYSHCSSLQARNLAEGSNLRDRPLGGPWLQPDGPGHVKGGSDVHQPPPPPPGPLPSLSRSMFPGSLENSGRDPLGLLAVNFPAFAPDHLADIYYGNKGDLSRTMDMLAQLELNDGHHQPPPHFPPGQRPKLLPSSLDAMDFPILPPHLPGPPGAMVPKHLHPPPQHLPLDPTSPMDSPLARHSLADAEDRMYRIGPGFLDCPPDIAAAARKLARNGSWYDRNGLDLPGLPGGGPGPVRVRDGGGLEARGIRPPPLGFPGPFPGEGRVPVPSPPAPPMVSDRRSENFFGGQGREIHRTRTPPPLGPSSPWLEQNDGVVLYAELREKAREHERLRNQMYDQATQAYMAGNKALAKELNNKGQWHNDQMKAAQAKTAEAICRHRGLPAMPFGSPGPLNGPPGPPLNGGGSTRAIVDLQGLHVAEAVHVLKREIEATRVVSRNTRQRQPMLVCVGSPAPHAKGPRAPGRLHVAVERFLQEEERVHFAEVQPGMLRLLV